MKGFIKMGFGLYVGWAFAKSLDKNLAAVLKEYIPEKYKKYILKNPVEIIKKCVSDHEESEDITKFQVIGFKA